MNSKFIAILIPLLFITACIPVDELLSKEDYFDNIANPPQIEIYSKIDGNWVNTNVISNSDETNIFYHTTTLYCSSTSAYTYNGETNSGIAIIEGVVVGAACTDRQDNLIMASCVEFYQFESSTYPFIQIYWSPEYTYSIPESDNDSNTFVNNIILNLAGVAVSEIGGLGASIAWAIGSSIVCSNTNNVVDTSTHSSRLFEWSNGTNNAIQQVTYMARTNSDEISKYVTEYSVIAHGIELLSAGKQLHVITGADVMPPHWADCLPSNPSILEEVLYYSLYDSQVSDSNDLLIRKALEMGNLLCAVSADCFHFTIDLPSVNDLEQDIENIADLQLVIHERLNLLKKQSELIKSISFSGISEESLCEFKIAKLNILSNNLNNSDVDFEYACTQYFDIVYS